MKRKLLFDMKSLYRDDLRAYGYEFGNGEKTACIMGATRGNEVQQVFICAKLVQRLKELEAGGAMNRGRSIMVVPSVNPFSMNIGKRFWPTDNTDINRMFPGYNLGETTQRIAAGIFEHIKDYQYGIQFASNYIAGDFIPHVRMMKTGFEDVDMAKQFELPYVVLRNPRPYDTTTLNYNWQIWETHAFSVYTCATDKIDIVSAMQAVESVLTFLSKQGIVYYNAPEAKESAVVEESDLLTVKSSQAGIFLPKVEISERVEAGKVLAEIVDPYEGRTLEQVISAGNGTIFFLHVNPMILSHAVAFRIIPEQ